MTKTNFVLIAVALVMLGTFLFLTIEPEAEPVAVTLTPGPSQPRVPPEEARMDAEALELVAQWAGERDTQALVVAQGGHIVFERYRDGVNFDTPVDPGFAPALAALLTGAAMNDREILNLDRPVSIYFDEGALGDAGEATVRDLLAGAWKDKSLAESTDLLALVLERVGKRPYHELVVEKLWRPMGGGNLEFRRRDNARREGGVSAACCVQARIGDWMRIGEMLAHDGVFEGNQYTPPGFVRDMLRPVSKESPRGYFTRTDGQFVAKDLAWLEGTELNRLWIVPSLRLAILRLGGKPSSKEWDEAMIPDSVVRSVSGWASAVPGGVDPSKFAPH